MSLAELIEPAFNGQMAFGITIKDGNKQHGFEVKPLQIEVLENGLRVQSSFRHLVLGKDDRVHYILEAVKGQPYKATLVKIDYNGLFGGKTVKVGVELAGAAVAAVASPAALVAAVAALKNILNALSALQKKLVGKWEPSAVQVIDALGARLSKEVG
jgi:hypothetical protein